MPLTAAQIVQEMKADPLTFLRHYRLSIAGGGLGANSGVATFKFEDQGTTRKGFTTGISGLKGKEKDRPNIMFTHQDIYNPNPDITNDFFNVHYVTMNTDGGAITTYAIPTNGPTSNANPDIMLTSQLSGCTFGIGSVAMGAQLLTHVRPDLNNLNIPQRRQNLHQTVTGSLGNVKTVFERENQPGEKKYGGGNYATIIGIRSGNKWRYYTQSWNLTHILHVKQL